MSLLSILTPRTAVLNPESNIDAKASTEDLEDVLLELAHWGRPYVHCARDGTWSVKVEASVVAVGAKFEVRSEYGHLRPLLAARECRARLRDAVKSMGGSHG